MKNNLNDLTGREWLFSTNSVELVSSTDEDIELYKFLKELYETRFSTKGVESYAHHIRKFHPTPKPPQLVANLIKFFTKENEIVFDPFCGVGGTMLGSSITNRESIGVDLNPIYKEIYNDASNYLELSPQTFLVGDATSVLQGENLIDKKFDMILTDPPYGNMMSRPKTGEASKKKKSVAPTPFSDSELDLGNMDLKSFLNNLKEIISFSAKRLRDRRYIIIFIKDLQPKPNYHGMLHYDIMNVIKDIDDVYYKGLKIWYDKSINLFPYGYPFAYVSNQLHQYILIFRKEEPKKKK